jgi:hypothetical protein
LHVLLQYSETSCYFCIQYKTANIKLFLFVKVLQNNLKVGVKCDYFEALHIEMHVPTSDLNTSKIGHGTLKLPLKSLKVETD